MISRDIRPNARIANYVGRILVIEYKDFPTGFDLPLYANGVPTMLFMSQRDNNLNRGTAYFSLLYVLKTHPVND